jgi:hypothetical protein
LATYDLGDGVNLRHFVYDRDGALTDATVALSITKPDDTSTAPSVTHTSLGQYDAATYVPAAVGYYTYRWTVTGTVTDVSTGSFTVADPAPASYATLEELKASRRITGTSDDAALIKVLAAASRLIDRKTGRRFYLDTTATARTYNVATRVTRGGCLLVDDIGSTTGLVVEVGFDSSFSTVSSTIMYSPDNALVRGLPIASLSTLNGCWRDRQARVTARWGWPAVPAEISQAALLLANRLYMRKDSPEGIAGSAEWGGIRLSRWDPDVEALVSPFMLPGFA